jgi:pseudaminic acid synthase
MSMTIAGYTISRDRPPMIIAEISGNHKQSLDRALQMVEAAAENGAHAVKLQTYTADTMTLPSSDEAYIIKSRQSPWFGRHLYELYEEAYTPWEWHQPIFKRAKELGIGAFSSAFDISAVNFLESIDTPAYKISSFECCDLQLLAAIARTKKPVILSCGMAYLSEINLAVDTLRSAGNTDIAILKCTSDYPADPEESNLKTIEDLRNHFNCEVGLSDHTLGVTVAIAAVALGATIIEKHFTLEKNDGAVDSEFSADPNELKLLANATKTSWEALGSITYGPTASEQINRYYRRSLYAARDIAKGRQIERDDLVSLRPHLGVDTKYINSVIGSYAESAIVKGQPIKSQLLYPALQVSDEVSTESNLKD